MDRRNILFGMLASCFAPLLRLCKAQAGVSQGPYGGPGMAVAIGPLGPSGPKGPNGPDYKTAIKPPPRFTWRYIPNMQITRNAQGDAVVIDRRGELVLFELFDMPMNNLPDRFTGVIPLCLARDVTGTIYSIGEHYPAVDTTTGDPDFLPMAIKRALSRFALSTAERDDLAMLIELVTPEWQPQDCPSETNAKPLSMVAYEWSHYRYSDTHHGMSIKYHNGGRIVNLAM